MSITEQNIKLLKSERITDFDDGGGRMTGSEVVDGQVNELFPDISQLDRTYGRVSIRKAYAAVLSDNADTYLGAHLIITNPPTDTQVNITLFSTESWTDERSAARNRIESYSIQGPESRWVLFGTHIEGQRAIRAFSLSNAASQAAGTTDPTPEVGDVLMLSTEAAGYTANYQFVRVTKLVSRETQKFTDSAGDFFKDVIVFEIGTPLRYQFPGAAATRLSAHGSPTLIRDTQVADAAQYFGVKKVLDALAPGDMTVRVDTPYGVLVPSAQQETPLVDVLGGLSRLMPVTASAAQAAVSATLSGTQAPDFAASLYTGRGIMPGGLALTIGGAAYKDDGAGGIVLATGGTGSYSGNVNYAAGKITLTRTLAWSGVEVVATWTPAVWTAVQTATASIPVSINNRQFNYVQTLRPRAAPGTVTVDFRALGKWYRLSDNGVGQLTGASGAGSGTIDYASGAVIATLGALPDIDSAVIFAWGVPTDFDLQAGVLTPNPPRIHTVLNQVPVKPGSLTITWNDGAARSATANAVGDISGDGSGHIVYATGEVAFQPNTVPASGTVLHFAYQKSTAQQQTFTVTGDAFGVVSITLDTVPVLPGSVHFDLDVSFIGNWFAYKNVDGTFQEPTKTFRKQFKDDAAGGILYKKGKNWVAVAGASINYTTGEVVFDATRAREYRQYMADDIEGYPVMQTFTKDEDLPPNTLLTAEWYQDSALFDAYQDDVTVAQLAVDLLPDTGDALIAGSVRFGFLGKTYYDLEGQILSDHSPLTDAGAVRGSIDYQTGLVTLTDWASGANTLALLGAVTSPNAPEVSAVFFRTPGSPLAPGSFYVRATTAAGGQITGQADFNGLITGDWMAGTVDWESGVAQIRFGKKTLDASLPAHVKTAAWYDPADIDGTGKIWVPVMVKPETIRFDAVIITYIPLDGDLLGVDTVRLPQDGRVPIFRVGNVAVIHHTATQVLPNPAVAGATIALPRNRLSWLRLYDALDAAVPSTEYTVDLDAGTLTYANPLTLTGFTQPLKAVHRIEDMSLVADVQITGQIALLHPVSHDFPANSTAISSALAVGDLQARVSKIFDQQTWDGVWRDVVYGGGTSAQFNNTVYPIVVTNRGCIQERWACVFTSSTAFNVYGEYSGLIASGNTATDLAPPNPETGAPYFSLPAAGWGSGWAAGNVLRFNTLGANYPLWLARTTLQGPSGAFTDQFELQIRGDAN